MDTRSFNLTWSDATLGQNLSLSLGASVRPDFATAEKPTPEWTWHVHLGDIPGLKKTDWSGTAPTSALAKISAEAHFRAALDLALVHISRENDDERSA